MKAAIFDFDGTLFDSMWVWENIDIIFLKQWGHTPAEEVREKIGTMSIWESAELFRDIFSLPLTVSEIVKQFEEIAFCRYRDAIKLKPYVRCYLEKLRADGIPMCIATAAPARNVEAALERENLLDFFDFILSPEQIKSSKDSPEIYLMCAKKLYLAPSEITVFEDSLHCIKTAKSAGFRVAGVEDYSGAAHKDEIIRTADTYIVSFKELID